MDFKLFFTILSALIIGTMEKDLSAESEILQSNAQFTNKLYKVLAEKPGNVFFSPISVHSVLSMSYIGAEGATKDAYVKSLALPSKEKTAEGHHLITDKLNAAKNITLYLANKVYVSNVAKMNSKFTNVIVDQFRAEVQSVDFKASAETAKTINTWVEAKTVNKIKDLISPDDLDQDTRLILVNAIYFKGTWLEKFNKASTRTEPFYLNENDKIDVQMMHLEKNFRYKHDDNLQAKVLVLPYENKDFSMVIILPDEKDGIKDLESKLEKTDLTKITEGTYSTLVNVALPKFKIETTIHMNEALTKLGLGEIFGTKADFSGMLEGSEPLSVSKVIQKAFIEVNEEGAEAAAATGLVLTKISAVVTNLYFKADHPFMFAIVYENGPKNNILFKGKITRPPM